MEFIATYWYIWLAVMIVGFGYALVNQLRQMKEMMTKPMSSSDHSTNLFKGIVPMIVASVIGASGTVMFVIAIIVKLIKTPG